MKYGTEYLKDEMIRFNYILMYSKDFITVNKNKSYIKFIYRIRYLLE